MSDRRDYERPGILKANKSPIKQMVNARRQQQTILAGSGVPR
jgi:hypothetical protein